MDTVLRLCSRVACSPACVSLTAGAAFNMAGSSRQMTTQPMVVEMTKPKSQYLNTLLTSLLQFSKTGKRLQINLLQLERLRQLVVFLQTHPDSLPAVQESGIESLLCRLRDTGSFEIRCQANIALALMGNPPPYKGRGLRILAIDGGGTKGLIPILLLQQLEQKTGLKLNQMFDYVAGTSTGAIVASLLFLQKISASEAEKMYRDLSSKIFRMNNLLGLGTLFLSQSFYDSSLLEKQIRKHPISEKLFVETSADEDVPRMSFVSTLANQPVIKPVLLTNYRHSPSRTSHYHSVHDIKVWRAIMATTAAPGYFEEVKLGSFILQDGALLANNPAAIALHEARCIWGPATPIHCLVSLGTGRPPYTTNIISDEESEESVVTGRGRDKTRSKVEGTSTSLREKLTKIVASATDTEAVHTVLQDLLPASSYYRLNPDISCEVAIDSAKPETFELLEKDTRTYIEQNEELLDQTALTLTQSKSLSQKVQHWYTNQWIKLPWKH